MHGYVYPMKDFKLGWRLVGVQSMHQRVLQNKSFQDQMTKALGAFANVHHEALTEYELYIVLEGMPATIRRLSAQMEGLFATTDLYAVKVPARCWFTIMGSDGKLYGAVNGRGNMVIFDPADENRPTNEEFEGA